MSPASVTTQTDSVALMYSTLIAEAEGENSRSTTRMTYKRAQVFVTTVA